MAIRGRRWLWLLAALVVVCQFQCRRGRPTFSTDQLRTIEIAATRPGTSTDTFQEPTYEYGKPFTSTIQPEGACRLTAAYALVYVAADPRSDSIVVYIDRK